MPESLSQKLKTLPHKPGCYLYKNSKGEIIYVGKAKDLKKRVSSYFQKQDHDIKTEHLVLQIQDVDFIVTSNELEAFILEAQLIKKHQPAFNIDLKAGERYAYIKITKEEFPRLIFTRKKDDMKPGERIYGPYTSGQSRVLMVDMLNKLFQLRVCKKLPKRACLLFHLKRCSAPCIKAISKEEYAQSVAKAEKFLKGDVGSLLTQLQKEMQEFSKEQKYEQAKLVFHQMEAIQHFQESQKMDVHKKYDQDVIAYVETESHLFVGLFSIQKGVISGKKEFYIERSKGGFEDFLRQYYFSAPIPHEILIPEELPHQSLLQEYISSLAGHVVTVHVPLMGVKKKLLDLVKENVLEKRDEETKTLLALQQQLSLPEFPEVIECFDISNIQGTYVVGSMVQFRHGKPDKDNYRRFKIKFVEGQNDVECMSEIVYRRYLRLTKEKTPLPQLVIIDGGKAQLSGAKKSLQRLNLNVPFVGLAKKFEEVYIPGKEMPIRMSHTLPELKLLQRIRDEAHRFAITYHRLLRQKGMLE